MREKVSRRRLLKTAAGVGAAVVAAPMVAKAEQLNTATPPAQPIRQLDNRTPEQVYEDHKETMEQAAANIVDADSRYWHYVSYSNDIKGLLNELAKRGITPEFREFDDIRYLLLNGNLYQA